MRININKEDMLNLTRYYFLMESNRNRWLFSYNDLYLNDFLSYYKLYHIELAKFNKKYDPNKIPYTHNFANNFIELKE